MKNKSVSNTLTANESSNFSIEYFKRHVRAIEVSYVNLILAYSQSLVSNIL